MTAASEPACCVWTNSKNACSQKLISYLSITGDTMTSLTVLNIELQPLVD